MSTSQKQKPCSKNKIRNPKSGRCVSRSGPIGQEVIEAQNEQVIDAPKFSKKSRKSVEKQVEVNEPSEKSTSKKRKSRKSSSSSKTHRSRSVSKSKSKEDDIYASEPKTSEINLYKKILKQLEDQNPLKPIYNKLNDTYKIADLPSSFTLDHEKAAMLNSFVHQKAQNQFQTQQALK